MDGTTKDHHKAPRYKKTNAVCPPSTGVLALNFQMCAHITCQNHRNQERNHEWRIKRQKVAQWDIRDFMGKQEKWEGALIMEDEED